MNAKTTLIYLNIALWSFFAGVLGVLYLVNSEAEPTPTTTHQAEPFTFGDVTGPVPVTYVQGDTLDCGSAATALGCYTPGEGVRILADLPAPLAAWVLAHETAHAYGAAECDADRYAYEVTGNAVIFHSASTYARGCGHYDLDAAYANVTA